jgi:alpha-N-acetylgalactosaminidase
MLFQIHGLGLKFGIYEDYGNLTCGGYPGILGHLEKDAKTLASWEVDYIKLDGCYSDLNDMETGEV